jgi:hypothetical protein
VVAVANRPTARRQIPKMIRMYQLASFSRIRAHIAASHTQFKGPEFPLFGIYRNEMREV